MIDPAELAIRRKRGHEPDAILFTERWDQCKWCGVWLRLVRTPKRHTRDSA
jgi:hypothetical protein